MSLLNYIYTRQKLLTLSRKEGRPISVSLSQHDLRRLGGSAALAELLKAGKIKAQKVKGWTRYTAAEGTFDPSLLPYRDYPQDRNTLAMVTHLREATLPVHAPGHTEYFNLFEVLKDHRIDLFYSEDKFSGRVHSPVVNLKAELRPHLLLYGKPTVGIDVVTMQPLILAKILEQAIPGNEYSCWVHAGEDIYLKLAKLRGITRERAKDLFYSILFNRPSNKLAAVFGNSDWITFVDDVKRLYIASNPRSKERPHSNMAYLLQSCEVSIMRRVWSGLVNANIPFLTVHDEIIVIDSYKEEALDVMDRVFKDVFPHFYKLKVK